MYKSRIFFLKIFFNFFLLFLEICLPESNSNQMSGSSVVESFREFAGIRDDLAMTNVRRLGSVKNCPCKNMVFKAKVKI